MESLTIQRTPEEIEKRRIINRRYYEKNKLKIDEINSSYQKDNKQKIKLIKKKSNARRYHCACCSQEMSVCTYYGHMNSMKHIRNNINFDNKNPEGTRVWTEILSS